MSTPGEILRSAREDADLSIRDLAGRAGVAFSTVHRIEKGEIDPTVGMLSLLLEAADRELTFEVGRRTCPSLADLSDAWELEIDGECRPDWTRLRGFLDWLRLHPNRTREAIARPPRPSGHALIDNILAAMAETISGDASIRRPKWTATVAPLAQEWDGGGTWRMIDKARKDAPKRFLERNLLISEDSLWRRARARPALLSTAG